MRGSDKIGAYIVITSVSVIYLCGAGLSVSPWREGVRCRSRGTSDRRTIRATNVQSSSQHTLKSIYLRFCLLINNNLWLFLMRLIFFIRFYSVVMPAMSLDIIFYFVRIVRLSFLVFFRHDLTREYG